MAPWQQVRYDIPNNEIVMNLKDLIQLLFVIPFQD